MPSSKGTSGDLYAYICQSGILSYPALYPLPELQNRLSGSSPGMIPDHDPGARSTTVDPGVRSHIMDAVPMILDLGSKILDPGLCIQDPACRIQASGPRIPDEEWLMEWGMITSESDTEAVGGSHGRFGPINCLCRRTS